MYLAGSEEDSDPRTRSLVEFVVRSGTVNRSNRSLAYMGFGLARICDLIAQRKWDQAEASTLLLLTALEQAQKDQGRWTLACLLTFMPDPPWNSLAQNANSAGDALRPFGVLASPAWTTTAMAYAKDASALQEIRSKYSGEKGKDHRDHKDDKDDKNAKGRGKKDGHTDK